MKLDEKCSECRKILSTKDSPVKIYTPDTTDAYKYNCIKCYNGGGKLKPAIDMRNRRNTKRTNICTE